jgi:WD40 repeat protein
MLVIYSRLINLISFSGGYVNAVALPSSSSTTALCGCSDGSVVQVDLQTARPKSTFFLCAAEPLSKPHSPPCEVFCVSACDENTFAAGTSDGRVLFWDAREGTGPAFVLDAGKEVGVRSWKPNSDAERVPVTKTGHQVSSIDVHNDWLVRIFKIQHFIRTFFSHPAC